MSDLVSTVTVPSPDGGFATFAPGDDVPKWAAVKMGDQCFEGGKHPYPQERQAALAAAAAESMGAAAVGRTVESRVADLEAQLADLKEQVAALLEAGGGPSEVEEPPRSGAGSGREAWAAYAAALGVDVAEDAGRDDIIAAVDARQQ